VYATTDCSLGDVRLFQVGAKDGGETTVAREVSNADGGKDDHHRPQIAGAGDEKRDATQEPGMGNKTISASQESSHFTDSSEQTAPVPYDMSNRVRLLILNS
jgi:hypothetical protein